MINGQVKIDADYTKGEWDPRWEKVNKPNLFKPPRGPKRLRTRHLKMTKMREALETMDAKIKERSKKGTIPKPFLERIFINEGILSQK